MELGSGKIVALLGHNGAGKSTVLNLICGLLKPTKGKVMYGADSNDRTGKIGYCGSETLTDKYTTLYQYLEFVANLKNIPKC